MNKILLFLLLTSYSFGQNYWQQEANYKIFVDINVKNNRYKGNQKIIYTNNSNDTLNKIFIHLYFNAFKASSDMAERLVSGDDINTRFDINLKELKPEEEGYLDVFNLKQDNTDVDSFVSDTILEVTLANPLLPGQSSVFSMDFKGQVPITIRRAGRDSPMGVKFSMAQWYPKISEYDYEGWNTAPYTGREFHGVWGALKFQILLLPDLIPNFVFDGSLFCR